VPLFTSDPVAFDALVTAAFDELLILTAPDEVKVTPVFPVIVTGLVFVILL
jgi:hypothetical protein